MNTTTNNTEKTFSNSLVEFNMANVRIAKEPVIKQNSDGSHRVTVMVSAGENRCYFLQDYVKAGVDPNGSRLATRVVGEALNVYGYLDGHIYTTQNGDTGYALSCNVTRLLYLTSKEERDMLVAKRAAAAAQTQPAAMTAPQQAQVAAQQVQPQPVPMTAPQAQPYNYQAAPAPVPFQ